jgi:sugar O-acyltransferase (sialic acid O-acetyltransferase NeuD family)
MNEENPDVAKVVVFGSMDLASLAHFYLRTDSPYEVVAFSVTRDYMPDAPTFEGLPVVAFEDVEAAYPPDTHRFFAPMTHRGMNRVREDIYQRAKAKGYELISYISSMATVFHPDAIGDNCFILEDNTVQPFVRIGDNVVVWSGNHIGHHSVIGDHVFFASQVVVSGNCVIERYSFFGVNSALREGIRIAEGTLVAMSASVTRDTEPWGVYRGVPAKKGPTASNELDF